MSRRVIPQVDNRHPLPIDFCSTPNRHSPFILFILFLVLTCTSAFCSEQTPAIDPNATPEQLQKQGDELRNKKMFADALDNYRLALRKGLDTAELHNKIGFVQMRLQHYDEARKEFDRAIKRDRNFASAYNNLGAMEYFQHKYSHAISAYRHAIEIDASSATYHKNLANAYLAHQDFDKAIAEYFIAVKINPGIFENVPGEGNIIDPTTASDPGRYYYMIARTMAKAGDTDRCLMFLRRALEEDAEVSRKALKDQEFSSIRQDPRFQELIKNPPTPLH